MEAVANRQQAVRGEAAAGELEVRLETVLPSPLAVGSGNALVVWGTCFHRRKRLRALRVGPAGREEPVLAHSMPRPDLFEALHPTVALPLTEKIERDGSSEDDPRLMSYRSGFWGIVPFQPVTEPTSVELSAAATLEDGTETTAPVGRIALDPGPSEGAAAGGNGGSAGPLVAVCMATYEPPMDLFERQVESIRSQTHGNWICLVSDDRSSPEALEEMRRILDGDPRFVLSPSPRRLGYYHNFERALSMTPPTAAYATFADQDDRWHPDKLETLLGAIGDRQPRVQRHPHRGSRWSGALRHLLVAEAQQLHEHGLAPDRQHGHRRRLAVHSRPAGAGPSISASTRAPLPRPLGGPGGPGKRADRLRRSPALRLRPAHRRRARPCAREPHRAAPGDSSRPAQEARRHAQGHGCGMAQHVLLGCMPDPPVRDGARATVR